jgi:hypothetical protein
MRTLVVVAMVGMTGCGMCQPDKGPPPGASASASPPASTAPPPGLASHAPHEAPKPKLACRVIALDGSAQVETPGLEAGTTPLLLQGIAQPETWIDLAKGTRVVAKDPRTTRETTFRGPARVRICVGFSEESWLASGTFASAAGAGETPGAEEWVVTPAGVVRYTAAQLSVEARPHETEVTLDNGTAFAWEADTGDAGHLEEGWLRLPTGKSKLAATHGDLAAAMERCKTLAASARSLAAVVMAPGAGADASTITQQVTARREARAACGVATLRVNALPATEAAPLLHLVAEANTAWSGLPVATP